MNTISLVGKPNVGKSSLFNVLTRSNKALVANTPGLTRDRHYSKILINDSSFLLIDTGGLDHVNKGEMILKIAEQTNFAIDESDIIFFVVDGKEGLSNNDEIIANNLRKKGKETVLVINKSEGKDINLLKSEFVRLGFKTMICISASHREGIQLLNDYLISFAENNVEMQHDSITKIKLSILGKPNVGKSTFINTIIGENRFISKDEPGTTRDSVSVDYDFEGNFFEIIDTAGIRRKGRVEEKIEKFSILKSIFTIENSNICILIIDAVEGITSQDLQIFSYIIEAGKPLVIGLNKWDALDDYQKDLLKLNLSKKINFLNNFEVFYISALKKIGIKKILFGALKALKSAQRKLPTPILNKYLIDLQNIHRPPIIKGLRPKLKYIHQGAINPPTLIIHGNHLEGIKKDYLKYLESSFIKTFDLIGTPLRIIFKESDNPYDDVEPKKKLKTGLVTRRKRINLKRKEIVNKKRDI